MSMHFLKLTMAICIVWVAPLASGADTGTYIAGTVWHVPAGGKPAPLTGQEIFLVAGSHPTDPGKDEKRLDQDQSSGPDAQFVLGTSDVHPVVSLLYYPYPRGDDMPPRFLTKVLYPKVDDAGQKWRAKVRLELKGTNEAITQAKQLSTALADALVASQMAATLDISDDNRRATLKYDLKVIAAMVPDELRGKLLAEATEMIERSLRVPEPPVPILRLRGAWSELRPLIDEAFHLTPGELQEIRNRLGSLWNK